MTRAGMSRRWAVCIIAGFIMTGLIVLAGSAVGANARPFVPGELVLDGTARINVSIRPVRFHFLCSANAGPNVTGVLSVAMEALEFDKFQLVFDFLRFEGPDAHAGALSVLEAAGPHGNARDRFAASGSIVPAQGPNSFSLEITASRRDPGPLRKLAAALRPLTEGQSQLVWTQESAKRGGEPLIVRLDVSQARSDQIKTALGACLDAH
jgi:hypothetical protein